MKTVRDLFLVALLSTTLVGLELIWTRLFSAEFYYTFEIGSVLLHQFTNLQRFGLNLLLSLHDPPRDRVNSVKIFRGNLPTHPLDVRDGGFQLTLLIK